MSSFGSVMPKEGSESHFNASTSSHIPATLGNPMPAAPAGQSPFPQWLLQSSGVVPVFQPLQHSIPQSYTWTAGNPFGGSAYSSLSRTGEPTDAYGTLPRDLQAALASHGGFSLGMSSQASNQVTSNQSIPSTAGQLYLGPAGQVSLSRVVSPTPTIPLSPTSGMLSPIGQTSQQQNLGRALEQYSMNLLRSQLDQAQQQAQVGFFFFF